ncbi:MAG TPA: alpha-D-ribose 1-methylphosphonate 5-triphosphate diphosphatase [Xanthobacteraceae bacterium]|nr:alpha-D-ribose 1-methylphosphonate 5-triphosphate diphosphatase [Xanthobacteraceae bacterium]
MTLARLAGRALCADGAIRPAEIAIEEGRIAALALIDEAADESFLILPGIIDLHGDAFERQLMPRPGLHFPSVPALVETDRQLLANGITTAYHGLTLSWEPGLRGADAARDFLAALAAARPHLGCDTRLHLRFETFNLDMADEVEAWLTEGRVDLLAFNEHNADITREIDTHRIGDYLGRTRLDEPAFRALFARVCARSAEVPATVERLAAAAIKAGIPLASHDDDSPEERAHFRTLGCRISEFPINHATATDAIAADDVTVLGAPNIMRGGSHRKGGLAAAEAVAAGLCSVLTSDYYYPALLHAPFLLEQRGTLPLAKAWDLVSRNAARAVGLADRGAIAPGLRADLVLVDDSDRALPVVRASIVAGELHFASAALPPDWHA